MGVPRHDVGLHNDDVVPDGLQYGSVCRYLSAIEVHTDLDPIPMLPRECIQIFSQLLVLLTTIHKVCCQLV